MKEENADKAKMTTTPRLKKKKTKTKIKIEYDENGEEKQVNPEVNGTWDIIALFSPNSKKTY